MDDVVRLLELEELKQLKARYCRLLDTKQWAAWRELFTDDFDSDTTQAGGKRIRGGDAFVAFVRSHLGKSARVTVHQVQAAELKLTSETTAEGIWGLNDVVKFWPGFTLIGYGHYYETYEKVGGRWRIKSSRLHKLRDDFHTPIGSVHFSDRIKSVLIKSPGQEAIS